MPTFAVKSKAMAKRMHLTIAGDPQSFVTQLLEIEKKYTIVEKYISTQVIQIQEPNIKVPGISPFRETQIQNTVLVSGFFQVEEKEVKLIGEN